MTDVQFADILFILLACLVIIIILSLVNKANKKTTAQGTVSKAESKQTNAEKTAEDD